MSGLAIRLGNNLKQIQKCFHRDVDLFSLKPFKGIGIAEMSLCSKVLVNNEKQEDKEQNTEKDIYILEELVKKKAKCCIQSEVQSCRCVFQTPKDQPGFKLDWSDVEVIPGKPDFEPIRLDKNSQEAIRVISNTMLTNRSKVSQWHKVKTERQAISACESSISKGCVIGGNIGISLPAPDVLGFSSGFSLRRAQRNFDEEKIAWVGTDCIKILKDDTVTVTIRSKQQRKEFNFTVFIGIRGAVYAHFKNPYTDTAVKLPISISRVLDENIPKLITKGENDLNYFQITGTCMFIYDVEHDIIIN